MTFYDKIKYTCMAILNIRLQQQTKENIMTIFYNGKANGNWKNWDEFIKSLIGYKKGYSI